MPQAVQCPSAYHVGVLCDRAEVVEQHAHFRAVGARRLDCPQQRLGGFAVLDHDPLDSSLVRPAATAICSELDELLDLATRLGCDANEQHYRFSEVCHRTRLRWDMRVPDAAVDKLVDAAVDHIAGD